MNGKECGSDRFQRGCGAPLRKRVRNALKGKGIAKERDDWNGTMRGNGTEEGETQVGLDLADRRGWTRKATTDANTD